MGDKERRRSSLPVKTRIAGDKTVADWLTLRSALIEQSRDTRKWQEAYDFFRLRIDTRFIKPIESILSIDETIGHGHAVVALQCVLLEFLEALFQGRIYRPALDEAALTRRAADLGVSVDDLSDHAQPNEYHSSASLFVSFLTTRAPFKHVFDRPLANTFYRDIRCGLLHEASTKKGSKILAQKGEEPNHMIEPVQNGLVIYRNAFQKSLLHCVEAYREELLHCPGTQKNFLRKMDDIAQIDRCFYFAYGSNMNASRIRSRITHIHEAYKAYLCGYEFRYNKLSDDGTAKANITKAEGKVCGICYEIDRCDFNSLQQYEKGYRPIDVWTQMETGALIAKTYISDNTTTALPSAEYIKIIVDGASERGLPDDYVKYFLQKKQT